MRPGKLNLAAALLYQEPAEKPRAIGRIYPDPGAQVLALARRCNPCNFSAHEVFTDPQPQQRRRRRLQDLRTDEPVTRSIWWHVLRKQGAPDGALFREEAPTGIEPV